MFKTTINNENIFQTKLAKEILFWIGFEVFFLTFALVRYPGQVHIPVNFLLIFFFFINDRFCFPFFFNSKRKFLFHLAILLSLISYLALRVLLCAQLIPALFPDFKEEYHAKAFLMDHTFTFATYVMYGFLYCYVKKLIDTGKKLHATEKSVLELSNKALGMEKERIKADYNYLKSQINPHFLYNTLNFFYAGTRRNNPDIAEGIHLLSEMMRYSLNEGGENGWVPLSEEWRQVHHFIELYQLRYEHDLPIEIQQNSPLDGVAILPHLLITLVENMFKHGDLRKPASIQLQVKAGRLFFMVENHVLPKEAQHGEAGGMGLLNVEKRLRYEHDADARLEYGKTENGFRATLNLPLEAGNAGKAAAQGLAGVAI
jgi:two-component system, LytTR family, sensor kinase